MTYQNPQRDHDPSQNPVSQWAAAAAGRRPQPAPETGQRHVIGIGDIPAAPPAMSPTPATSEEVESARSNGFSSLGRWASGRRGQPKTPKPAQPGPAVNPFLPASQSAVVSADEGQFAPVVTTGPALPTGAPAPADPLLHIPAHLFTAPLPHEAIDVQIVGLHGGAGASTIASMIGPLALDCGGGLRDLVDLNVPVLLVTRTSGRGLSLLRRAVAQWASGGLAPIRLIGVVLVDDAPTLSKALAREVRSLERALPHSWRLAWDEELRHSDELPGEATGGRLRRIRKSVLDTARKAVLSANETTTTEEE